MLETPREIGTIEVAIPVGQIEMCSQVPMWRELIKIKKNDFGHHGMMGDC